MKKLIVIIFAVTSFLNLKAQRYTTYDTIKKQELSISVLPVLNYFSGMFPRSEYTNFNFSYKYYFKNKFVLRSALITFPSNQSLSSFDGVYIYDRTIGIKNVFYLTNSSRSAKNQFNIGIEKIFKSNRLMHGFGAELFINNWQESSIKKYEYRYIGQSLFTNFNDTTNYSVDSLSKQSTTKFKGVGLQIFYSLRYQITKRWYVSSTIGPSLAYLFVNSYRNDKGVITAKNSTQFYFPNVGFISDISICFRL